MVRLCPHPGTRYYYIVMVASITLASFSTVRAQSVISKVCSDIISYARQHSLYRNHVDWTVMEDSLLKQCNKVKQPADVSFVMNQLLESLGDEHGRIVHDGQVVAYYYSGQLKPHQSAFDAQIYSIIQQGTRFPFMARMMNDNTGYLRIPGMSAGDDLAKAKEIQDAVCSLRRQGADKWIIDLRYNGGGNINPMAEGLTSILGDGSVGGASGLTSSENVDWHIADGDFYNHGFTLGLEPSCSHKANEKVAVLTSLYTASSGEALAVMFKGRVHTRFFGSKTLGMVTGTGWHQVDPHWTVMLSLNYFRDRNGQIYKSFVDVDEECPLYIDVASGADQCMARAIEWLIGD